jgi:hypothetical protein
MAWTKSTTTKHTCNGGEGPHFGRKTPGCPRCEELLSGAAPVAQAWRGQRQRAEEQERAAVAAHFAGERHRSGGCGPVCTYGEW